MTPPFYIVMIFLFILIIFAIDRRSWGHWARAGYTDLGSMSYDEREHDIEIRARYRRIACEHVPTVSQNATIRFPDPTLDSMIFDERFKEANIYRMRRVKEARERRDKEALETYEIYKALISAREAACDERSRRTLRDRFPEIQEDAHVPDSKKYDPMEILEPPGKKAREKIRSGFLEIASMGIRKPPLKDPEPETPPEPSAPPVPEIIKPAPMTPKIQEEIKPVEIQAPLVEVKEIAAVAPEAEKTDEDEDYTGLITI